MTAPPKPWREVLEVGAQCGLKGASAAYRRLMKQPGGSPERREALTRAWADAEQELSA